MRIAEVDPNTKETQIRVKLGLDGTGEAKLATGVGYFDHMLDQAMRNYKDESFVGQFLSPKLMRDFRLFAISDDEAQSELEVSAIHDDSGYRRVREALSHQYDLGSREPNIQVWDVNLRGDRALTLRHFQHNARPLDESAHEVLKHVARLWGFGVHLESVNAQNEITKFWTVPAP